MMKTERTAYLDYLRIAAMLAVIVLHTASYSWYDADISGSTWAILNGWKAVTRWCVPIFVMISGSCFLGRDIPFKTILTKYILRLVVAFVVWSLAYAAISSIGQWQGIGAFAQTVLTGHYHMWFIPMMIGLYLVMPLLRLVIQNEKATRYFLLLAAVLAFILPQIISLLADFGSGRIIAIAEVLNTHLANVSLTSALGYTFYFVLGYVLSRTEFSGKTRLLIYVLGIVGFIATFILTFLHTRYSGLPQDTYHGYLTANVALEAIAVFTLFRQFPRRSHSLAATFAGCTFGAYLVHAMLIEAISRIWGITAVSFTPVAAVPAISLVTAIIAYIISWALHRIPKAGRYIS